MWDKGKAMVRHSVLQADSTYVVLTHGEAHADIQVQGPIRLRSRSCISPWCHKALSRCEECMKFKG